MIDLFLLLHQRESIDGKVQNESMRFFLTNQFFKIHFVVWFNKLKQHFLVEKDLFSNISES